MKIFVLSGCQLMGHRRKQYWSRDGVVLKIDRVSESEEETVCREISTQMALSLRTMFRLKSEVRNLALDEIVKEEPRAGSK